MHFKFRDVNSAFQGLVTDISTGKIETEVTPSRVGDTLQILEPVTVTYLNPKQRVLFNQARDSNPFFNVYEAMFMLAGRNEIAPLEYYASDFGKFVRDADNPNVANAAYGYRWRHAIDKDPWSKEIYAEHVDQLSILIDHLKRKPNSRRAVLSIWNVQDDLMKLDKTNDNACNCLAMFSIENSICSNCDGSGKQTADSKVSYNCLEEAVDCDHECQVCGGSKVSPRLNMTVCNRSNDLTLGMLGANVVHFSFLLEYMAACIGVEVGVYNQFTNNLHAYTERWFPDLWLKEYTQRDMHAPVTDYSFIDTAKLVPLVKDSKQFDKEVVEFVEIFSKQITQHENAEEMPEWKEPFLTKVARPMMIAFQLHKIRDYEVALDCCKEIESPDWQYVSTKWIQKRQANYLKKSWSK